MKKASFLKLKRSFYKRDVITVAQELPGKYLVKETHKGKLIGKIVEVEAYDGRIDEAAHTYRGKTERNSVMFGEGGFFYVYFTYGNHFCCNVVTGFKDHGTAVLIRAVEPVEGIEQMALNRYDRKEILNTRELYNLTSGPGKLCKAFDIDRKEYGLDLTGSKVYLVKGEKIHPGDIVRTKRIGIKKSTELQWRFYIKDNPFVSGK